MKLIGEEEASVAKRGRTLHESSDGLSTSNARL